MTILAYAEIDLFGMIILFLFYLNQRRSGSYSLDDRIFNTVLLIGIYVLLLDGVLWLLDGFTYTNSREVLFALTSLSYVINPLIAAFWMFYCDLRVHADERGLKRRAPLYVFPYLFNVALVIVNFFKPVYFIIGANNEYIRQSFFCVYFSVFYVYLIGAIVVLMGRWRNCTIPSERRDLVYMMLFSGPPILGGIVQGLFYGTSFTWPSAIISFVIVYINVLNRQISTDSLTGLNNRRMLQRYLDMKTIAAEVDSTLFLLMLDVDNFKSINDTYGHAVGDRALTQLADILKTLCSRRDYFLSRLGGDEFVIVGHDEDHHTLDTLRAEITERIEAFNASGAEAYGLAVSIGTASFHPAQTGTTDAMLIAADLSMYAEKAKKKQA